MKKILTYCLILFTIILIGGLLINLYAYKIASESYRQARLGNTNYAYLLINTASLFKPSASISFLLGGAYVFYQSGDSKDSLRLCKKVLASSKTDQRGFLYVGEYLAQLKEYTLAKEAFQKAINSENTMGLSNLKERAFIGYARILISDNQVSDVLPELVRLSKEGHTPLIQKQALELINSTNK